ncbi:hypothetical protein HSR121_1505 [Halapricum desulfuricans]|uniref:Uncharacterized protein n=1 Tax=Halapricum desulfuricans TaxID=2841257 RepID=A0A897N0S6_9EURY|nr:hypothetical protein HSR121_1505 [Halapricum desulfuricans]
MTGRDRYRNRRRGQGSHAGHGKAILKPAPTDSRIWQAQSKFSFRAARPIPARRSAPNSGRPP